MSYTDIPLPFLSSLPPGPFLGFSSLRLCQVASLFSASWAVRIPVFSTLPNQRGSLTCDANVIVETENISHPESVTALLHFFTPLREKDRDNVYLI